MDKEGKVARMESTRLKNIVIWILVLVNVFLLISLAIRKSAEIRAWQHASTELTKLFAADGITLDASLIPDLTPPPVKRLTRSTEMEQALTSFLLGDNLVKEEEGGGIFAYQNENGLGRFHSNGKFDITGQLGGADGEAFCRKFCSTYGYRDFHFTSEQRNTATAIQYSDNLPAVNCTATFLLQKGRLVSVSGTRASNTYVVTADRPEKRTAHTALTAFLGARRDSGAIVSAVTSMDVCYQLERAQTADMTLVPVWRIGTDTVTFYVNCYTGAVTYD